MNTKIVAPWTEEMVRNLNQYQHDENCHPFTYDDPKMGRVKLIATKAGWVACAGGLVVQTLAHAFMAEERNG